MDSTGKRLSTVTKPALERSGALSRDEKQFAFGIDNESGDLANLWLGGPGAGSDFGVHIRSGVSQIPFGLRTATVSHFRFTTLVGSMRFIKRH